MKSNFLNSSLTNIYSKPASNSEVLSQILYGEKFKILNKKKGWVKIKTNYDNYIGYIKNDNFYENFKPEQKIFKLKSKIFIKKNNKFLPTKNFLYFASGVSYLNKYKNFIEFKKNNWIKKSDTKEISHQEKNFLKIIKLFLNSKYLWGGKTSDGIDCSALIQVYFYYNRIFFPRDSKDQIKFCKKKSKKKLSKGDIIFWKGHVGLCLNNSKFIHAYGPKKKVIIMPTKYAINLIYKTAKLVVKKISNIKNY
jgi:hypothetical protein